MSKKAGEPRSVNIAVVGVSGFRDSNQAFSGVGKSCLCNRFVRPLADEYITEHSSVFSSSDFGGRVLNNDQYLYWGSATKTSDDGSEFLIHVIEQTELIDDATLMPLSRGGIAPYPRRCAISKLSSPEKLMYISRDQVALQNDYKQVCLPGGKITVDGFLVVYDAKATQSKLLEEQQERLLSSILMYVQKSKKPFVMVATKCDDTQLNLLQEVHRFAQSKKLNVPIIETSSHKNVNVDLAFVVLAQLIERGRVRCKVIPFTEAQKTQREILAKAVQDFERLIDKTVTDWRVIWQPTKKLVENEREFQIHRDLCGLEACKKLFDKHIRKRRKEFEKRKLNGYLSRLSSALDELMPSASSMDLCQWNWQNCQKAIRNHKEFLKWMIILPEELAWCEGDHLLTDDPRVPLDVLSLPSAEQVFQNHAVKLKVNIALLHRPTGYPSGAERSRDRLMQEIVKAEEKRLRMMKEFRKLLELTSEIRPGTVWVDAAVLLQNEESFQYLNDSDKRKIFDAYHRDITEKAKADFQELLFESAEIFSKLELNTRTLFSQENMRLIKDALRKDDRYKRLDKLDSDRQIGLINHIALLYRPTRCLSGVERYRDRLMQEGVATTTYRPHFMDSSETLDSDDSQIKLLNLGGTGFAQAMESEIWTDGDTDGLECAPDGHMYELNYQVVDGDVDLPEHALQGTDMTSQVPSQIEARGPRAKLAYENALKTGKVRVYRARIMLIGQDRAGKTSLKKSLLGLQFDPKEQSTEGIEVDPSKFNVDVDQAKNWQRTDEKLDVSYFANDLARMVAGELQKIKETHMDSELEGIHSKTIQGSSKMKEERYKAREMDPKSQDDRKKIESQVKQIGEENNTKTKEAPAVSHHIVSPGESATSQPVISELKIDASLPPEEFTDLLVRHLKGLKLQSEAATVEHHMSLDLWDFAGQHVYYASYPVFLSLRAVYLLVYNLGKGLKNIAQPRVRQGIHDILLRNPNHETNLENLLSWLVTVRTMCSTKSEMYESKATRKEPPHLRPSIFIVGTHADEPFQDIKEMELQIQKEISDKDYELHIIRPFFSVDNTQGSSGEGVAALQKRMIEVLKQEPYMGEEVPLRWFNFEKVVQALVADKVYYLNLEQLQGIIQEVCFIENENEAATMLDFYHDLGMIVKHRNTVVLRAQWLIDVFKQLITIRSFSDMEPRHSKLWQEMETTGVLNMELVDHVFSKFCQHGLIKDDILNMMEQFGLIVKFATSPTDEMYFVPCQLKTPPEPLCKMEPSPSDPCPLYLHFHGGFVSHGLFSQLVSRCTRWCSMSGFEQPPNLFDGASRFIIEKELTHHMILLCKKRFIKIVLKQTQPIHGASFPERKEVAILVRTFLDETIQNLTCELPWLSNLTYDLCVACPDCPRKEDKCSNHSKVSCTHEDCLCLLKIQEDGKLSHCPNSFCAEKPMVLGLEKWFSIKAVYPGHHPGTDDVYNMTARPSGITLIVNNKLFDARLLQHVAIEDPTRHGSEEDVRQVEALFDALGFDVHTKENLTRLQLLNELDSFACQDHSGYDCFVLWLMSHGKSGEVFCSDGATVPIQTAQDMFSKCDTLSGKPKLFFIQACRGYEEDEGVTVKVDISTPIHLSSSHVDSPIDTVKPSASKVPTHADFLYSFSTVDEHVSYRHKALGSYYIRALVEVFRERAAFDHLLDILTAVNQKVSDMEATLSSVENRTDIKTYKQMPEVKHTLRKKVRF